MSKRAPNYVERAVNELQEKSAKVLAIVAPIALVIIGAMSYFLAPIPGTSFGFALLYCVTGVGLIIVNDLLKSNLVHVRQAQAVVLAIPLISHAWAFQILFESKGTLPLLLPTGAHLGLCAIVLTSGLGERRWTQLLIAMCLAPMLWGIAASGVMQVEALGVFSIVVPFAVGLGWMSIHVYHHNYMVTAKEVERLKLVAPAHIIKGMQYGEDLRQAFAPKERLCVFLSSDWRGYQELSSQLSIKKLAESLGQYYERCESILSEAFPEGNYFSDWIADEYFVVIFTTPTQSVDEVIASAMQACEEIIRSKEGFYRTYGFPEAIDIGLSCGTAYTGMLGPSSSPKATALGQSPGRARRLQTAGKQLRALYGAQDRVVFDEAIKESLSLQGYESQRLAPENHDANDLEGESIYFNAAA